MSAFERAITIDDLRVLTRSRLPRALYDYIEGGAGDEATLVSNGARFAAYRLLGRALAGTATRDQSVELFGRRLPSPVIVAPTGGSGLFWPAGEAEVARACAAKGTVMMVSAGATLSLEDIAVAAPGPKWLQLFIYRDRGITRDFATRAAGAGYEALCLTVDCPIIGPRERDLRNGLSANPRLTLRTCLDAARHPRWWLRMGRRPRIGFPNYARHGAGPLRDMHAFVAGVLDPTVGWKDLEWLRGIWSGPLIVKGIMRGSDATRALAIGCDAIQVSNHGGRQLDQTIATIDALGEVATAVEGRIPVLLDGGIRRGTDVLKAVALGARAVAVGRAHLWGLAAAGQRGVEKALAILSGEIDCAMAIGGWDSLRDLDRSSLRDDAGRPIGSPPVDPVQSSPVAVAR
jgi:isopentenyl diphosphate isomerase/L-lactate dehydrogenase-like FMN-dependent dehydrogenase